jgi:hypothetical protein
MPQPIRFSLADPPDAMVLSMGLSLPPPVHHWSLNLLRLVSSLGSPAADPIPCAPLGHDVSPISSVLESASGETITDE